MNQTITKLQAQQKKWSGHGRTGRTADYGLGWVLPVNTVSLHLLVTSYDTLACPVCPLTLLSGLSRFINSLLTYKRFDSWCQRKSIQHSLLCLFNSHTSMVFIHTYGAMGGG